MKIGIDFGHNCSPNNTGARGIRFEDELIVETGNKVVEKLKRLGHEIVLLKPNSDYIGNTLNQRVQTANVNKVDLVLSIHYNCGGGTGCEVFAVSTKGREYAQRVVNEIAKLGYKNRGVKDGSHLALVHGTNAPAILVEGAFVDSIEDMNRYNAEDMAIAIVKGITGQAVKEEIPQLAPVIRYQAHVQDIGWQNWIVANTDEFAGSTGKGLRLEALIIQLENSNGNIIVEGHIQDRGWQSPRSEGEPIGTIGQSLRLECIKMHLEGVDGYKIQYRSHCENIGWTEWVENGVECGSTGKGLRIEAIQIRLVKA